MIRWTLCCFLCYSLCFEPSFAQAKQEERLDFTLSDRHPNPFSVYYKEVVYPEDGNLILVLSDGSLWKVNYPENAGSLLSSWKNSHEIRIDSNSSSNEHPYLLKNARTKECLSAHFLGVEDAATVYVVQRIDKQGYALLTEDGLEWSIGYMGSFHSSHWRSGDRLLINKSSHGAPQDYLLINVDTGEAIHWASLIEWR